MKDRFRVGPTDGMPLMPTPHLHNVRNDVVDPVCGMTIDPADAAGQHSYRGTTYYFCNASCLDRFREDPERFIHGRSGPPSTQPEARAGQEFTCPMHPEVRQDHPGACPTCGMALEPV